MKINHNKSNHFINKLYAKSFIGNKKEMKLSDHSCNQKEINKNNKSINGHSFLNKSNSARKKLKKYNLNEKCDTLRESFPFSDFLNYEINKTKSNKFKNNKKRTVILAKKNINKKMTLLTNNEIKMNAKRSINKINNYNNSAKVASNKTINHIRIKNPKLNTVLNTHNESKIIDKNVNYIVPIRNYNSLNKNNNNVNKSLNTSINKRNNNIVNTKRYNNSFKLKVNHNNHKYFDSTLLKNKFKNSNSIEKGYINFYKVDKKHINNKIINKIKELNNNTVQVNDYNKDLKTNEIFYFDKEDDDINENENENIKKAKTNEPNLDIVKLKLDNINNEGIDEQNTERDNKNMKEKSKTSLTAFSSKSARKRKVLKNIKNNKEYDNIIIKMIEKEKNDEKKYNETKENYSINRNINKLNSKNKNNSCKGINIYNNKLLMRDNFINNEEINNTYTIIKDNYNTISKNYLDSDIFDDDHNRKNCKIFEVISNVKVKSFIEYEEDKKNLLNKNENESESEKENNYHNYHNCLKNNNNDLHSNITDRGSRKMSNSKNEKETPIIINNDEDIIYNNDTFIKDRDEYDIILKETFSKDRFSFRPTNKDSNETIQDTKLENNNNVLYKKDFINTNRVSSSQYRINTYNNCSMNKINNKKKRKSIKNNTLIKSKVQNYNKSKTKELKNYKK